MRVRQEKNKLRLMHSTLNLAEDDSLFDNANHNNMYLKQYDVNDIISMSIQNDEIYTLVDDCLQQILPQFHSNTSIDDIQSILMTSESDSYKDLSNYFNNYQHKLCNVLHQIVCKIYSMQSSLTNIAMIHIPVEIVSYKRQISPTSLRRQPTVLELTNSLNDLIFQTPKPYFMEHSHKPYLVQEASYKFKKNKSKHPIVSCEGCGQKIDFTENNSSILTYEVPYITKTFYFHDEYCVNLRKYIEIIRLYCSESQLPENKTSENISECINNLLTNVNNLIGVKGNQYLPKPIQSYPKNNDTSISMKYKRETACILLNRELEENLKSNDENGYFNDIPIEIQYCDASIYGVSLWKFIMQQLLIKQIKSLWILLAYFSQQIATIKAIELLQFHICDIAKVKNIIYLELVCSSVIENSNYPIASALLFSNFVKKVSENDLSRKQQLSAIADKYTIVAERLVESVESDHLLSIYLEIETDLNQMNVFEIAINYEMSDFFDNNRVEIIFQHMWSQFEFLNPKIKFRNTNINLYETLTFLLYNPCQFYFSPIGGYYIQSIMYLFYVILITIVIEEQTYLYNQILVLEWLMWICNAGYALFEFMEMICRGIEYFSDFTNYFDIGIMINWCILFFIRMTNTTHENIYLNQQQSRNSFITTVYMTIFAIQIIILYCRIATIFIRNKTLGPFIRMIGGMMSDILNFAFVCLIFFLGFSFALRYVLANDINTEQCEYDIDLSNYYQVSLYVFVTLLGQQEWTAINSNGECFSEERAIIATIFIIIFSILGTVLLLNLLIAMMSTTYEEKLDTKSKEVNFSRTAEIYQLAHRQAIIPPPLNIFVFGLSLLWYLIELFIYYISCGEYCINVWKIIPIYINYDENNLKTNLNCKTNAIGLFEYKYCQFCKCEIIENGNIDNYFALFDGLYRLDEDDVKMIKNNMINSGLCSRCFRPFKLYCDGSSNRLAKWQIIIEIISFYVFIVFLYCPLLFIIFLPALLVGFWSGIQNLADKSKNSFKNNHNNNNQFQCSRSYKSLIRQIISQETTKELEGLENKLDKLMHTIHENNDKTDIDIDLKTIINTLNKQMKLLTRVINKNMIDTNIKSSKNNRKQKT